MRIFSIIFIFIITCTPTRVGSQTADTINVTDSNGKKQGHWIVTGKDKPGTCYKADQKVLEGKYKDDRKTGCWTEYYCNGKIRSTINYNNGIPEGQAKLFYESGNIEEEGIWKNKLFRPEKCYYENGQTRECRLSYYPTDTSFKFKPKNKKTIAENHKDTKQTGKLTGRIILRAPADTATLVEKVMLQLNLPDGRVFVSGLEKNLTFHYDSLASDTTELRITTVTYYLDTIVKNIIIDDHKITYLEIPYPPYCEFDKSKSDSICPVCNKFDLVDRIIYEPYPNPPKGKRKRNKYWDEHNFKKGCDPHWYCRRDNKKF